VLEGTLNTHQGDYPAGSFVRFPEGGVMQHGVTQDQDVTFLFITKQGVRHPLRRRRERPACADDVSTAGVCPTDGVTGSETLLSSMARTRVLLSPGALSARPRVDCREACGRAPRLRQGKGALPEMNCS
jgi:hypothetical protein